MGERQSPIRAGGDAASSSLYACDKTEPFLQSLTRNVAPVKWVRAQGV